jgi:hypothetical protein
MAAPLRKVSENYHQTLKRAQVPAVISPSYDAAKASGEKNKSPLSSPTGVGFSLPLPDILSQIVRDLTKLIEDWYRPRISSVPFFLESALPPGLYTAIAHNGPLRRRIQDNCDEIGEFKAHIRHARGFFLGWLATLYHLTLVAAWYTFVCSSSRPRSRIFSILLGAYDPPSHRVLQATYS